MDLHFATVWWGTTTTKSLQQILGCEWLVLDNTTGLGAVSHDILWLTKPLFLLAILILGQCLASLSLLPCHYRYIIFFRCVILALVKNRGIGGWSY